jgi:hypothetical protein
MDAATLNKILTFIETDFRAAGKLPATGQREVFQGTQISSGANCIIKLCPITPINVGRIQRERYGSWEVWTLNIFPSYSIKPSKRIQKLEISIQLTQASRGLHRGRQFLWKIVFLSHAA